jgi:hypothetical protein
MRRRRKRRSIDPTRLLWVLLVANLISGLFFSRLTSIGQIRVEGAQPTDEKRIQALLVRVHDKPSLQVNPREVETWLQSKGAVAKAEMTRNIFGRALVSLEYRRPVGAIEGMKGVAISRDGTVFQCDEDLTGLPTIRPPKDALEPHITLTGTWNSRDVAGLASELADISHARGLRITSSDEGRLSIIIGSKFAVDLGDSTRLDEKIDYLKGQLDAKPDLLESGRTLVLVSIENPMYREGVGKSKT